MAINILQYLKHCQWGLKLLHHPHHGIPRTNQLLDLYISFSYDLSLLRTSNLWRRQQWSNSKNWKKVSAPRFNVVLSHLQSCSAQWVHAMPSIIEKHYFFSTGKNVVAYFLKNVLLKPVWSTEVAQLKVMIAKANLRQPRFIYICTQFLHINSIYIYLQHTLCPGWTLA